MKLKENFDFDNLKKYGFSKIIKEDDLPFVKLCDENPSFEGLTNDEINSIIDEEEKIKKENYIFDRNSQEYTIQSYDYVLCIGHARRGQHYYLLVDKKCKSIIIYASEPDGSGGTIELPDVLIKMSLDGIFV